MKYRIFLLACILLFAAHSCKRENFLPSNASVSGRVIDSCSGMPISGADVSLYQDNGTSYNSSMKLFDIVKTDADGNYKIKFHARRNEEYSVLIQEPYNGTYYSSYKMKPPLKHVKREDHITYNATLLPSGSLSIAYNDVTPFNPLTDSLHCVVTDGGAHTTNYVFTAHGNFNYGVDVILGDNCFPLKVYMNWDVTKNNITTSHSDSIICTQANQAFYHLNY